MIGVLVQAEKALCLTSYDQISPQRICWLNTSAETSAKSYWSVMYLTERREKAKKWMLKYNYHPLREILGDLSPLQFLERHNQTNILSSL